jgi:hypothetical protein
VNGAQMMTACQHISAREKKLIKLQTFQPFHKGLRATDKAG